MGAKLNSNLNVRLLADSNSLTLGEARQAPRAIAHQISRF